MSKTCKFGWIKSMLFGCTIYALILSNSIIYLWKSIFGKDSFSCELLTNVVNNF